MKTLKVILIVTLIALSSLAINPALALPDDHVGIETTVNGVTISKYILYSGYNMPVNHQCVIGNYPAGYYISDDMENLQLYTQYEWWFRIQIRASNTIQEVKLSDRFGAEFGACIVDWQGGDSGQAPEINTKGASNKVFLTWDIGTIQAGNSATVWLHVWTDHNPAGNQEFTSYGTYYLNSGAVAKWNYNGVKYSAATGQLSVSTIPSP